METIEFKLQRCLNNIEDWATENGFKFSKTKTQCVHFCQIRQLHLDPHLTIIGGKSSKHEAELKTLILTPSIITM